ncbi:hypothetical protein [Thermoactinomyces mirandus]|uniref:Uncharacterized protein n=1 Tax=Thermoactinomyces mirandus TaxID=2756294 RepID=A0A7W2ASL5_9BACL|nr:hypothetical protein [Thermoactinomyces mirandus]MBA4602601.1 hypothetical protein [Thermoactinomyces mirandus]
MTAPSLYPGWVLNAMKSQLTEEEWEQIAPYLLAETWTSPAARKREWQETDTDIPLRFQLQIDIKT